MNFKLPKPSVFIFSLLPGPKNMNLLEIIALDQVLLLDLANSQRIIIILNLKEPF